jgi:hypothetical protein
MNCPRCDHETQVEPDEGSRCAACNLPFFPTSRIPEGLSPVGLTVIEHPDAVEIHHGGYTTPSGVIIIAALLLTANAMLAAAILALQLDPNTIGGALLVSVIILFGAANGASRTTWLIHAAGVRVRHTKLGLAPREHVATGRRLRTLAVAPRTTHYAEQRKQSTTDFELVVDRGVLDGSWNSRLAPSYIAAVIERTVSYEADDEAAIPPIS